MICSKCSSEMDNDNLYKNNKGNYFEIWICPVCGYRENGGIINMDWILCGVQSPEEDEDVLLTYKNSAGIHVWIATYKKNKYLNIVETNNETYEEIYGIPIAWMKMPEPYIIK